MKNLYFKWTKNKENRITTLAKLFSHATMTHGKKNMAMYVDGSQINTYNSFKDKCIELSHLLSRYSVGAGDKVAILSQNMPNWTVAMFTAVTYGRVAVPILPDSSEHEIENIIRHSDTKVLFVSGRLLSKVTQSVIDKLILLIDIETFQILKSDDKSFTCEGWVKEPQPDDLACIIYTSGTSGNAKGVMLSHMNLCHNIIAAYHAHKCTSRDRWLSILPMSHTYEMAFSMLYPIYVGGCVYYIKNSPTPSILMEAMKIVKPTVMCAVPLIIEKIYKNSIIPTINKSNLLSWMKTYTPSILYYLIGKKLKLAFGGKIHFLGIGGSKLDGVVEEFLIKAKFPYAIGYGLTETAPLISGALVGKTKVGSIGVPMYGVQMKLSDINPETGEGEIVVKGPNVMIGYYKDPERTKKVISNDGWFRTNDLACVDNKGRYYIKGRLTNMILGPSGENIYPEEIEQVINNFGGVNESLVMQRNGKLVALVKLDDNILDWNLESKDKLFENIQAKTQAILNYVNNRVSKQSKVNEVELVKEPFEKTATQKIRRFKYADTEGDDKKLAKELLSDNSK